MYASKTASSSQTRRREESKWEKKTIGRAHTLWVFGRREGGVDVEKLHQTVFDLSSFEGGGELGQGEQGLPRHQAKNSVARGGLIARDITAIDGSKTC
jgi:hypothetical protein